MRTEKQARQTDRLILSLKKKAHVLQAGKKFGTVRYPEAFKNAVIEVVLQTGMKASEISGILNISTITLSLWIKKRSTVECPSASNIEKVRELFLVQDDIASGQDGVRIQFGSKIWIEAPVSALRGELFRELAALGAS